MRRNLAACILLLAVCSFAVHAQTKQEQVAELVRLQGFQGIVEETIEQSKGASREIGRQALAQLLEKAPNMDSMRRQRIEDLFTRYLDRCANLWTADELVAIWTNAYGRDLTEADLKRMLEYYRSPVGAKDIAAGKSAARAFSAATSAEGQRRIRAALDLLVADIKKEMAP